MSVGTRTSFLLSSVLSILLFSGMQMYKHWLAASPLQTVFGGYLASILFMLVLTAVGNFGTTIGGKQYQTRLPEIILCQAVAIVAAGLVHRVCTTTCILFSLVTLYYMNNLSQKTYAVSVVPPPAPTRRKKGN